MGFDDALAEASRTGRAKCTVAKALAELDPAERGRDLIAPDDPPEN